MAEEAKNPEAEAPAEAPAASEPQQVRIEIDDSNVEAIYANMCRVSSTPEEVILDLALNPNPVGTPPEKIRISQRVILNHFTAKRLVSLLASAVQRHEATFGVLETDVRKRVKTQPEN